MNYNPKYEKIKELYKNESWTKKMLHNAVNKGLITEKEYKEIIGGDKG